MNGFYIFLLRGLVDLNIFFLFILVDSNKTLTGILKIFRCSVKGSVRGLDPRLWGSVDS